MANDKYLLESGLGGYLLEDGSGVLLLDVPSILRVQMYGTVQRIGQGGVTAEVSMVDSASREGPIMDEGRRL